MAKLSFLLLALAQLSAVGFTHQCVHGTRRDEILTGVDLPNMGRVKRSSEEPIRFSTYLDSTVTSEIPEAKRQRITNIVVPAVLASLKSSLSVIPVTAPITLDRQCEKGYFSRVAGVRACKGSCLPTHCGTVAIPDSHLKRCEMCDDVGNNCAPGDPPNNGPGISNADYILYISANQSECSNEDTLAFAAACQMESSLDRPIAGYVNFCPKTLEDESNDYLFVVTKHELLHALGFSLDLMAFWRFPNGSERTSRDEFGQPPTMNGVYQPGESTVGNITYQNWTTFAGPVNHTVTALVTEAVVREGRAHFGCPSLEGVELEQQGGRGTEFQHWEKRALGNEAMTGVFTFDPRFSRLSLAVLEDSGWYSVSYTAAQQLEWGRGKGCGFVTQGCGGLVGKQDQRGNPFCSTSDTLSTGKVLGCTLNRGAVARCNRINSISNLPPDFKYFSSNTDGGSFTVADYCPFYRFFSYTNGKDTNCTNSESQPSSSSNAAVEEYGMGSRCVEQGQAWKWTRRSSGTSLTASRYGGGCYQYECSGEGVAILVRGASIKCSCEGEEHVVNITTDTDLFEGSLVCPACSELCRDQPATCPSPVPDPCYGRRMSVAVTPSNTPSSTGGAPTPHVLLLLLPLLLLSSLLHPFLYRRGSHSSCPPPPPPLPPY